MDEKAYPPVPPVDPQYPRDMDWAYAHYAELERAYPNQWVAVVEGRVVAAGPVLAEVRGGAAKFTDRFDIAILFVERGIHAWFPVLSAFGRH